MRDNRSIACADAATSSNHTDFHQPKEPADALSENTSLSATRDMLLPQLMSGKLRVKDAEKVLEEACV